MRWALPWPLLTCVALFSPDDAAFGTVLWLVAPSTCCWLRRVPERRARGLCKAQGGREGAFVLSVCDSVSMSIQSTVDCLFFWGRGALALFSVVPFPFLAFLLTHTNCPPSALWRLVMIPRSCVCWMPSGHDPQLHTKGKHGGWSSMKASGVTDEELLRQCVGPILAAWFSCVSLVWS